LGHEVTVSSLYTLLVAGEVCTYPPSIRRPGPEGLTTGKVLIALALAHAVTGLCSDSRRLGAVGRPQPRFFPHPPGRPPYSRRSRRSTAAIATVRLMVAELLADGRGRRVGGALIGCANDPGCAS
jgi:hypothetical protein